MDELPSPTDAAAVARHRRWLRDFRVVLSTAAITISLLAGFVASRIPYAHDLYNLVNHNERLQKGESTYLFLFGFPAMLVLQSIMWWLDPKGPLARYAHDEANTLWAIALGGFGATMFGLASVLRILEAWDYYHH